MNIFCLIINSENKKAAKIIIIDLPLSIGIKEGSMLGTRKRRKLRIKTGKKENEGSAFAKAYPFPHDIDKPKVTRTLDLPVISWALQSGQSKGIMDF